MNDLVKYETEQAIRKLTGFCSCGGELTAITNSPEPMIIRRPKRLVNEFYTRTLSCHECNTDTLDPDYDYYDLRYGR